LLLLGAGAVAWTELASRTARLTRRDGPRRITEGEPYPLAIRMVGGLARVPGGVLEDPILEEPVRVPPLWRGEIELDVRLPRRGRRRLAPSTLTVRDPLGLYSRTVRSAPSGEILVLPRVEPVAAAGERGAGGRGPGALGEMDGEGAGSRPDAPGVEFEIDGLRTYRDGSPASRIHWPSVARTGELMERRLLAGAGSARLVVLDAKHPASEEHLDSAVRAAASLCVHLAGAGGCTLLLPGESRALQIDPRLAGWPAAHTQLALVNSGDPAPSLGRVPRAAAVFWVTGAESKGPPRALLRFGAPTAFLVTPNPAEGLATDFTVAGCAGQVVTSSRGRRTASRSVAA
ncbi:MAG: DUF58 domain-containing protein, partial [Solirubrobacterales bacterium]